MPFGVKTQLDMDSIKKARNDFEKHIKDLQDLASKNPINMKIDDLKKKLDGSNNSVKNISNETKTLGSHFEKVLSNATQWFVALTGINTIVGQIKDGFSEIISINKANTNIAMITGDSVSNVEKMNQGWLNMAKDLKVVNSEVMAGAESWLRSGVSMQEANKNLETTTKLSKIAGQSNQEMADSLIVIKNAYDLNSKALEGYASKVALLDNSSATSSEKINKAMMYSAETFKSMGVGMDDALSMITNFSEKSAKSGESIGRGFVSMMTNFHKMQDDVKNGDKEETDAVNKLELMLSQKGIALRKNKDEWNELGTVIKSIQQNISKFSEVEKSDLAFKIGGKENMELTLSTLNNMQRINELNQKLKDDSGAVALNNSYSKYLDSIEAKQANLKNSATQLWTNLISSTTIKNGIDLLDKFVTTIDFMATDSKKASLALVGLSASVILIVKNFTALTGVLGALKTINLAGFLSMMSGIVTSIKTFSIALLTNPITWFIAAIGVATVAISKYISHQKELKQQTEKLIDVNKQYKQALADNNTQEMKNVAEGLSEHQKKIDGLIDKHKELNRTIAQSKQEDFSEKTGVRKATKGESESKQNNAELEKEIALIESAGIHYDRLTNKIVEYEVAESKATSQDKIDKIQQMADKRKEEDNNTIGLINRYEELVNMQNRSSAEEAELNNIISVLKDKYGDLSLAMSNNGGTIAQNINLLGQKKIALQNDIQAIANDAEAQAKAAVYAEKVQIGQTAMTIAQIEARIAAFNMEATLTEKVPAKMQQMMDVYAAAMDRLKAIKSNMVSGLTNVGSSGISTGNSGGYFPVDTKEATKATKSAEQTYEDYVNKISSLTDKLVNALKKKYEDLKKADLDRIQAAEDEEEARHNATIKNLQAELDAMEEKQKTEDNNAKLSALQTELSQWSRDDSQEGKQHVIDLQKQISDLQKEMQKEDLQNQIKHEEQAAQTAKDGYEQQKKDVENHYKSLLEDANIFAEANKLIVSQNQQEILNILESFDEEYKKKGQLLGSSFANALKSEISDALSAYSSIKNGSISPSGSSSSSSSGGRTYTVQSGDTMQKIAKKLGMSWQDLWNKNKDTVSNPSMIYPGQVLKYKEGGLNTTTGLAWLDGTPSQPERILPANLTKTFDDFVYNFLPKLNFKIPDLTKQQPIVNNYNAPLTHFDVKQDIKGKWEYENAWDNLERGMVNALMKKGYGCPQMFNA